MKVTVQSGTVVYVVCDHGETQPLEDSRITSSFTVQEIHYFRAAERVLKKRDLASFDQTIHVHRKHANDGVAEAYLLDLMNKGALQGLVTFESKVQLGAISLRYLRNGIVMPMQPGWQTGKSTEVMWRIMGGKIWTQP